MNTTAQTILEQLGGRRFLAMTGARNLVAGADYLNMAVPNARYNGKRVSAVWIKLEPSDTYTVEARAFGRKSEPFIKTVVRRDDVYCDNLQDVFTALTGLYTRL